MIKKVIALTGTVLVLALAGFLFFRFYFVFGEGVKEGSLNQVVYKGYLWKTYEGRIIQDGLRSAVRGTKGSFESYKFEFSVTDEAIAQTLMAASGKSVQLHYKEYLGALPWRGQQKYIVDKIVSINDREPSTTPLTVPTEDF